jgi:N-acetylmuramoyl-L-alanine amidase
MTQTRGLIVLDPGHGEKGNPHTTAPGFYDGFYEGTQNFILAGFLREALLSRGFSVLVTRASVTDNPSLEERGRLAGENRAILFLSLHSNAPATSIPPERYYGIRGSEIYYSLTDPDGNVPLAEALSIAVAETMQTPNRGIKVRAYPERPDTDFYGVIRNSVQSGCQRALLIEHGFHTNPEDSMFLRNPDSLRLLASAEADVIDRFFAERGI